MEPAASGTCTLKEPMLSLSIAPGPRLLRRLLSPCLFRGSQSVPATKHGASLKRAFRVYSSRPGLTHLSVLLVPILIFFASLFGIIFPLADHRLAERVSVDRSALTDVSSAVPVATTGIQSTRRSLGREARQTATSDLLSVPRPPSGPKTDPAIRKRALEVFGTMPLSFEANQGQTDQQVKYLSRGADYTLLLTSTEAVFSLREPPAPSCGSESPEHSVASTTQPTGSSKPGPV